MLRTTVVTLAVTLAACSSPTGIRGRSATTSVVTTTTSSTLVGPPLPTAKVEVVGAWKVVSAGTRATFTTGSQVTFLHDGTFLFDDGYLDGGGTWTLDGDVLRITMRGSFWSYVATASDRQLRLVGLSSEMTIRRV